MICYRNALVIDGKGQSFKKDILVEDGRILGFDTCPTEAEVVDLEGSFILPGLINCHVHVSTDPYWDFGDKPQLSQAKRTLMGLSNLKRHLAAGITFVRDMGGFDYVELDVRDAVARGDFVAAEMIASGRYITMTGGHGWKKGRQCDGVDECKKAAREQFRAGADMLKLMATGGVMTAGVQPGTAQLDMEEMKAAIDEAKKRGARTASHAQGTQGIKNAILAGIDSIEHGIFLDDEAIQMMVDRGVYLVPTLVAPFYIVENGIEAGIPAYAVEKSKSVMDSHMDSFKRAVQAGVKIAMGTDSGTPFNPHGNVVQELLFMQEGGMSSMEVIEASTYRAAQLLQIDENYGSLEVGKVADFLVTDKNPLEDLRALDQVRVFKKGQEYL